MEQGCDELNEGIHMRSLRLYWLGLPPLGSVYLDNITVNDKTWTYAGDNGR